MRKYLMTGVLAAVLSLVTVAPALADSGVPSAGGVNHATFLSYGEHLYNCDDTADGHHAVVQWVDAKDPDTVHTRHNYKGKGSCQDINLSLPEGSRITYVSCVGEGSWIYNCGDIMVDRA